MLMRKFLEPESVAVIGVPRQSGPGSFNNVEIMIRYGFQGRIYPINPNAGEICGIKSFGSVAELPEVPDLAIISVGRERVAKAVQDCGDFGIKRVIIITQGFSDADCRGAKMQDEISRIAMSKHMRILGPNTLGVVNNYRRFTTSFIDLPFPEKFAPVSLIAQTGVIQVAAGEFSPDIWGKALDIGNGSDIDHVDALQFFADDPETKVILVHIEGIRRGREFLELAGIVTREKPVIVFKTGRSSAGAKAAVSHTGSLVGQDEVADAAFRRAGVIRPRTMTELQDAIHALLLLAEMKGPRIGVLTASGAAGIVAADEAEERGLRLAEMPEKLSETLTRGLPDWIHVGNPVDYWPMSMIGGKYHESVSVALSGLLESPGVDGVVFIVPVSSSPLHSNLDSISIVREVRNLAKDKPISVWPYIDPTAPARFETIQNTACFPTIERAVDGLAYCYQNFLNRAGKSPVQRTFEIDESKAENLLAKARCERMLLGSEALELLSAFGIPVAESTTARNLKDLERTADEYKYPVVLKISGKEFIHKTEMGGVVTSIKNKAELHRAYRLLKTRAAAAAPDSNFHFILQKQATGREVLIGLKKDPQFGPVVACGAGGIYTEVLRDIARELVPVDASITKQMLQSLKIYPMLKGTRGEAGVDLEGLCEVLERISYLATKVPDIAELDINPVMASPKGCLAVDARIIFD
jgi:acetyltransferase